MGVSARLPLEWFRIFFPSFFPFCFLSVPLLGLYIRLPGKKPILNVKRHIGFKINPGFPRCEPTAVGYYRNK
jgi:hypothetical protein